MKEDIISVVNRNTNHKLFSSPGVPSTVPAAAAANHRQRQNESIIRPHAWLCSHQKMAMKSQHVGTPESYAK
jgi:hypothetical protein